MHDYLKWSELLNDCRFEDGEFKKVDCNDKRPAFERDYGRIAFSSAFRRFRDKTQVFPLTSNDNIHNRLTHSLEVSLVGKSLVRGIVDLLKADFEEKKKKVTHPKISRSSMI